MALSIEALAAAVIDLVLLRVMLRLENEPGADHPKERRWMLAAGVLLLVGCIAEIALRGAHIMQILLGIGFNLAFVAYFFQLPRRCAGSLSGGRPDQRRMHMSKKRKIISLAVLGVLAACLAGAQPAAGQGRREGIPADDHAGRGSA